MTSIAAPTPPRAGSLPSRRFVHPEPVDLRTAWEAERRLATAPDTVHHWCDDEHGWLLRAGLDRILEPVLLPGGGGATAFYRFADLGSNVAADLLRCLPAERLATERQNDGPTLGAVLRAVVTHPDRVRAHGYVVGPGRCDERLTVEGVLVRVDDELAVEPVHSPSCQCDMVERIAAGLGIDDALAPPHETSRLEPSRQPVGAACGHWFRLWWD